jgi:hypothetical protein
MDRDKRWDRVTVAIKGLIAGEGEVTEDPVAKIEEKYEQGETDEFLKPIIVNGDEARIKGIYPPAFSDCQPVPLTSLRQRHPLLLQLPCGPCP